MLYIIKNRELLEIMNLSRKGFLQMKVHCYLSPVILAILLLSCNHATKPAYQYPYEQWRSLNLHDYTIDQSRECYCIGAGVTVRLTVRADTIANVTKLSGTDTMFSQYYCTVDSLFAFIRRVSPDSLVVKYNSQYGYPEHLDLYPQMHPVDGGEVYETSNLQVP
jgi:hypothetical protein